MRTQRLDDIGADRLRGWRLPNQILKRKIGDLRAPQQISSQGKSSITCAAAIAAAPLGGIGFVSIRDADLSPQRVEPMNEEADPLRQDRRSRQRPEDVAANETPYDGAELRSPRISACHEVPGPKEANLTNHSSAGKPQENRSGKSLARLAKEEYRMIETRSLMLTAGLLMSGPAAMAASPDGGHYVWVPDGAVVVVPAPTVMAADFPLARMIAQQEEMMQRIFADMDSLMGTAMRYPDQMISVVQNMPQLPTGSSVVVTSITTPSGTCSQTITYDYPGYGREPVVNVSSNGDACGAIQWSGPLTITQPMPGPQTVVPGRAAPRQERLWTVDYPPHPVSHSSPPRT
jgi:hypothetical protein